MKWLGAYLAVAGVLDVALIEMFWVYAVPELDQVEVDELRPVKAGLQATMAVVAGVGFLLYRRGHLL